MMRLLKRICNRMVALAIGCVIAGGLFLAHHFWGLIGALAIIAAWCWAGKSGIKIFEDE